MAICETPRAEQGQNCNKYYALDDAYREVANKLLYNFSCPNDFQL